MKLDKEFSIASWAIDNKNTVWIITLILFIGGIISYKNMPKEIFPDINMPTIFISTIYPGNASEDVEKFITDPIEKEIKNLSDIETITSQSQEDYSIIKVEFSPNIETAKAKSLIKEKIDVITSKSNWPTMPNGSSISPEVIDLNLSELIPIMNINISGNYSAEKLRDYAESLQEKLNDIEEIKEIKLRGVEDKEVEIGIDLQKLISYNLSINDIVTAIQRENITISGGNITQNNRRKNLRVIGQFTNIEQIKELIIKSATSQVKLKDIAQISFKTKKATSIARAYSKPVIMLDIIKQNGRNQLLASSKIKDIIKQFKEDIAVEGLDITITNNNSDVVIHQINQMENSIILGVILVFAILLLFLGLRNAFFVGISIPLSVLMSMLILSLLGISLNNMTLFAIVMGLGMLVDNGIVVVENVYRLRSEGLTAIDAAKQGVGEIAWPIITSTATTIAAFSPLLFWPGMTGKFMSYFPLTLSIVLLSSLFVAIVINSMMSSRYLKLKNKESNFFENLENFYSKLLKFAIKGKRAYLFFFGSILLLILSLVIFFVRKPKILFFPKNQPNQTIVYIKYPEGTDIEKTNNLTITLENKIAKIINRYTDEDGYNYIAESIVSQVGSGTNHPQIDGFSYAESPNKAKISIFYRNYDLRRGVKTSDIMEEIQKTVSGYSGVEIIVDKDASGPPIGFPISIELNGEDYNLLLNTAKDIKNHIISSNILGIEELNIDVNQDKNERRIIVDRDKANSLGISTAQIGMTLRDNIYGKTASTFKHKDKEYDIIIRAKEDQRSNINTLLNQSLYSFDSRMGIRKTPLSALVQVKDLASFSTIKHKNIKRTITIYSNVLEGYNPNEIIQEISERLEDYDIPNGVRYKFAGAQEKMNDSMGFLAKALLLALALIALIIVTQFNSITKPIIILMSVILSLAGVFLGMTICNDDFVVVMTMMGIIALAGIVVNNAIVLIDYSQILFDRRKEELGLSKEDMLSKEEYFNLIIEGGKSRLRPVLLTALTTIIGLIPLAIGLNIDFVALFTEGNAHISLGGDSTRFWGPISWTIIYGLTFATFLTLIIVPAMFYMLQRFKLKLRNRFNR